MPSFGHSFSTRAGSRLTLNQFPPERNSGRPPLSVAALKFFALGFSPSSQTCSWARAWTAHPRTTTLATTSFSRCIKFSRGGQATPCLGQGLLQGHDVNHATRLPARREVA